MKTFSKLWGMIVGCILLTQVAVGQTTYYSTGSLDPTTLANWNTARDGSGSAPDNFTTAGDVFILQGTGGGSGAPHSMTAASTWNVGTAGNGVTLTIESGATLQADANVIISSSSTFNLHGGATYVHNHTSAYASGILNGIEDFHTQSNFIVTNSATTGPGTPTGGFGNLTWNTASSSSNVNSSGALTNIKGNLTVVSTGTGSLRLTGATALTLSIGGDFTLQTGTVNPTNGAASPVINLSGNFTMNGGTLANIGTGGTTEAPNIATINFVKNGTQTFTKTGGTITAVASNFRRISFVVASGSTLDMGTNILNALSTTNCDFTVNSGGTVRLGDPGGIVLEGSLASTGNIQTSAGSIRSFSTGGNYEYNGSSAQETGTGLPATVNNLTINNAAGVSLTNGVAVNGTLTLTSGNLSTSGSSYVTVNDGGNTSGGNSSSFVNGPLAHIIASTSGTSKTFPIGKGSAYRPITLTVTQDASTSTTYTAEVFNEAPASRTLPSEHNKVSEVRYWNVTKGAGAGVSNGQIALNYGADDGVTDPDHLRIAKDDGAGNWVILGGTGSASGSGSITSSVNFTDFSDFTLANHQPGTNPLPVQLTSFTASANRLDAVLRWETATEVHNYGFDVERRLVQSLESNVQNSSLDSKLETWNSVGFVRGSGTSTSPREYSFVDAGLAPGRYAYRIKQIDSDGSFEYFSAAEVEIGVAAKEFSLGSYPNPFNPETTIEFTLPADGRTVLKVYNTIGQEVATLFNEEASAGRIYQVRFSGESLPSGVYFYTLSHGGQHQVKKLMLVK
jgi:hypothetical protein